MQTIKLFPLLAIFLTISCTLNDSYNGNLPSEPDFDASGVGINDQIDLFINILASRNSNETTGFGTVVLERKEYGVVVIDSRLSTDFNDEPPIPQTDDFSPFEIFCTPGFAELTVILQPGDFTTTFTLNECEKDNSDDFNVGSFIINPCADEEEVDNIEQFNGPCLEKQ